MASAASTPLTARLVAVVADLGDAQIKLLLEFAEYLQFKQWQEEQDDLSIQAIGELFADDEPEYTLADVKD